jgi:polysaccharide biosynthesis transport protein
MMNNLQNQQNNYNFPNGEVENTGRSISFKSIMFAILKRPFILLATVVLIMAPAIYISLSATRMYMSRAVVMVPVQETTLAITSVMGGGNDPTKPEHYYTSILQSTNYRTAVGIEVAERMPELGPPPNKHAMSAVGFSRDPRQPGLFTLSAMSAREDLVEPFVDAAVDVFKTRISNLDQQEARAVVDFIDEQLLDLNQKTIDAEENLQRFLREKQFVIDDPDKGIAQELTTLESDHADAVANLNLINLNLASYERQIQDALGELASSPDTIADERVSESYRKLDELKQEILVAEEAGASEQILDSLNVQRRVLAGNLMQSTVLQSGQVEIQNDISLKNLQEVVQDLVMEREKAENRVNYLRRQTRIFRQRHPNISEDILEYTRLLRKRDVLKQTLEILLEKREEARIKMAAQLGGLKVLEDSTTPSPLARHTPEKLAIALLISGLLGVVLSFLVDYSIQTIDADRDITDNFKVSVLGILPPVDDGKSGVKQEKHSKHQFAESGTGDRKLITNVSTQSWFLESLRSIKTSLFFYASENKVNCFVVTSPLPSEGKSLTTANLAISIAQGGKRVVIVDGDLRRPTQNKLFAIDRKPGISDYLLDPDTTPLDRVIQKTHVAGLDAIPAGSWQQNPSELLGSKRMSQVLSDLRSQYDYVIIDSPPVLPAVDSRLLGTLSDGLVLVAHAEQTKIRNFESALNMIRNLQVPIVGAVLNHSTRKYGFVYYKTYGQYQSHYYYKPYSGYYGSTEQEEHGEISKNGSKKIVKKPKQQDKA